jgi:hypothetical protein
VPTPCLGGGGSARCFQGSARARAVSCGPRRHDVTHKSPFSPTATWGA